MNETGMNLAYLEAASFWSNIVAVALTVLAAIATAFALYFSLRVGRVKDQNFARFQLESTEKIAEANERSGKLEHSNLELQRDLLCKGKKPLRLARDRQP
jgi:hypothetical protein